MYVFVTPWRTCVSGMNQLVLSVILFVCPVKNEMFQKLDSELVLALESPGPIFKEIWQRQI